MSISHLIIGDPHRKPKESLDRFTWLGRAIMELRPTKVICMGDFNDMGSLSSYDMIKPNSIKEDIDASHEALDAIDKPHREYRLKAKKAAKDLYYPKKYMLGGNHDEDRIFRAIKNQPELAGLIDIHALGYTKYGWNYIPYTVPLILDGIAYCHHFASGIMGKPIGGKYLASSLVDKNLQSSTVGHDHGFSYASRAKADGSLVHGLSAGCYTEDKPSYAKGAHKFWWRGLILKTNVKDGDYSLKQFTMDEIKERWG